VGFLRLKRTEFESPLRNEGNSPPLLQNSRAHYGGVRIFELEPSLHPLRFSHGVTAIPPSSSDKGKVVVVKEVPIHDKPGIVEPILEGIPVMEASSGSFPLLLHKIVPSLTSSTIFSSTTLEGTHVLSPTSPLDRITSPNQEGESSSQGLVTAMDYEDDANDLYLELKDLNDPILSTDSSKKRKLEEGNACSSHPFS